MKDIARHITASEDEYVNSVVKVGGVKYKVNQRLSRNSKVCGTRAGKADQEDTVWISQEGQYIVVGISPTANSEGCRQALINLNQHLNTYGVVEYDNITTSRNEVIYDDTSTITAARNHLNRL